eukprot:m.31564 g.31564  ORF g.31564 m.31564 type:complete len:140 (+) comp9709_c0_seq1:3-422(+)
MQQMQQMRQGHTIQSNVRRKRKGSQNSEGDYNDEQHGGNVDHNNNIADTLDGEVAMKRAKFSDDEEGANTSPNVPIQQQQQRPTSVLSVMNVSAVGGDELQPIQIPTILMVGSKSPTQQQQQNESRKTTTPHNDDANNK